MVTSSSMVVKMRGSCLLILQGDQEVKKTQRVREGCDPEVSLPEFRCWVDPTCQRFYNILK